MGMHATAKRLDTKVDQTQHRVKAGCAAFALPGCQAKVTSCTHNLELALVPVSQHVGARPDQAQLPHRLQIGVTPSAGLS